MVWMGFKRKEGSDAKLWGNSGWGDWLPVMVETGSHFTVTGSYTHQMLKSETIKVKW